MSVCGGCSVHEGVRPGLRQRKGSGLSHSWAGVRELWHLGPCVAAVCAAHPRGGPGVWAPPARSALCLILTGRHPGGVRRRDGDLGQVSWDRASGPDLVCLRLWEFGRSRDLRTLVLGLCRRFHSASGRPPRCLVGHVGHLQHQCLDSHPPHSACVPRCQAELEGARVCGTRVTGTGAWREAGSVAPAQWLKSCSEASLGSRAVTLSYI